MNNRLTIAVWLRHPEVTCFAFDDRALERLTCGVPGAVVTVCRDEAEFRTALPRADVAAVWRFKQAWFDEAPRLRLLVTPAAGRDYFCVTPPAGVRMHYGGFHGAIMGETVVGMILGAARGILATAWLQGGDSWPRRQVQATQRSLHGAHVAIVGFGNIGEWIGRLLKPFGVHLTGVRRQPGERPACFGDGDTIVTPDKLDSLLPTVDHLVLALPGGTDTDGLVNGARLALLPDHAWVYNVGRGNVLDEHALSEALRTGRLAGACLDVYQTEPLPEASPLRTAPNVLLMPHVSAVSPRYMELFCDELIEVITAGHEGSEGQTRMARA